MWDVKTVSLIWNSCTICQFDFFKNFLYFRKNKSLIIYALSCLELSVGFYVSGATKYVVKSGESSIFSCVIKHFIITGLFVLGSKSI